ncbi:glucodextranase DOMON-like domain-containing protein, partial [Corallococcus carmarthensis]
GWEKAVVLTPRPYEAREALRKQWRQAALDAYEKKTGPIGGKVETELNAATEQELEARVFFPTVIQVSGRTVIFQVPDRFLGAHASADWGYGVAVTGATIERRVSLGGMFGGDVSANSRLMAMGIMPGEPVNDRFGGGRKGDVSQSPVVDLLVAPGATQEEVLGATKPAWSVVVPSGKAAAPAAVAPDAGTVEDAGAPVEVPDAGPVEAPDAGSVGPSSPAP